MKRKANIYIGTSGWYYKHWKGVFYPEGTKDTQQFSYYARQFSTVEINNSFYKLPDYETFVSWRTSAPPGFIFSVKVSRYITHMKKLKPDADSMQNILSRADGLKSKLGPLLFQLPPKWNVNTERLEAFLNSLPKGYRFTFEFRDHSWYIQEVYDLLQKFNCAFCIYHLQQHLSPLVVTADFVYLRLHGPGNKYEGSYTKASLKTWSKRCSEWQKNGKDVYVYFDNDQAAYAAFNAQQLKELTD